MALPLKVEKIEDVEEAFRSMYVEKDGIYYLDVEGLPDTAPLEESIKKLEAKNKELIDNNKKEAQKRKAQEDEAEQARAEAAKKSGDVDALEKSWQAKFSAREKELLDQLEIERGRTNKATIGNTVKSIAADLGKDKYAQELLEPQIQKRLKLEIRDGDAVTVVIDEDGKPSATTVQELIEEMRASPKYAALVLGTRANGPGSSSNGDGSTKKFSDYNGEQLVKLKRENPEEYKRLKESA